MLCVPFRIAFRMSPPIFGTMTYLNLDIAMMIAKLCYPKKWSTDNNFSQREQFDDLHSSFLHGLNGVTSASDISMGNEQIKSGLIEQFFVFPAKKEFSRAFVE